MTYRTARPEDQREPIDLGAHQRTVDAERVRDAAPELLEACRKALTCRASMNSDVADVIRAAIAKAEPQR